MENSTQNTDSSRNDGNTMLGEVKWFPMSEIKTIKPNVSIMIWQHNLSDEECSRFQRAFWYEDSHIDVYPLTHRTVFDYNDENGFYEGYDLEGDFCRVTHFALVNAPN